MLPQVSNPSIQFMLYETLLKKLKKRRLSSSKGSNVSALEVIFLFFSSIVILWSLTWPCILVVAFV